MDFHGLTRRELQTLCKKNKIPANMTNVAMADALTALTNVEGIEEIGRVESVSEKPQPVTDSPSTCGRASTRRRPAKDTVVPIENDQPSRSRARRIIQDDEQEVNDNKDSSETVSDPVPQSPKTGLRASTRRRPVRNPNITIENNPESSKPITRTQGRTRRIKQEEEQENKDPNDLIENPSGEVIPKTPAMCNGRRRATGASVVKAEQDENEKQVISRVCSTRRSARLQSKTSETSRKTGGRTATIQIAALSEEENEELTKKPTSFDAEIKGVSGENAKAEDWFSAEKGSCNSDTLSLQVDSTPNDASAIAISNEVSGSIASNVPVSEDVSATETFDITGAPDQMTLEKTCCSETEVSNFEVSNAIIEDHISKNASATVVSTEVSEGITSLEPESFTVEKTLNSGGGESEAEDSMAAEKYLVEEEDASAPKCSTEKKNVESVTKSSDSIAFEDVVELGVCEEISFEFPSCGLEGEMLGEIESGGNQMYEMNSFEEPLSLDLGQIEDLDLLLSQPFDGYQSDNAQCAASPLDKQNVVSENTDKSSGLSKDLTLENEEFNNVGLQVVVEDGLHADASSEIPSSLSETWNFELMKGTIQECLNGREGGKCVRKSAPLDVEVPGEMVSVDEKFGENSLEEPNHSDFYSTDNPTLLHCQTHDADIRFKAAQSIEEPSYEKMVVSDMELEKLGRIVDFSDANLVATAKILSSSATMNQESCEKTDTEMSHGDVTKLIGGNDVCEPSPALSSFLGLSDEVSLSSTTVSILNQVPSCLSPCSGLASESGNRLNQVNVTPTRSSMTKKVTPSQRGATIMVLDENKEGNYSGGTGLRKKSNSKVIISAAEEKENYSGGLSLRKKSNSKAITSVGEENENKDNCSGGLGLRNKSNSKVITSVAEEKENNNKCEDSIKRPLEKASLRQLKKMFKERMLIVGNTGDCKNNLDKGHQQLEKTRAALQTLTDNSLLGSRED